MNDDGPRGIRDLPNDRTSPLFLAVVEAVEEAVYNSLTRATTVDGRDGHVREAIPIGELRRLLDRGAGVEETPPTHD